MKKPTTTRREALKKIGALGVAGSTLGLKKIGGVGVAGTAAALGLAAQSATAQTVPPATARNANVLTSRDGFLLELKQRVDSTVMVDSHEHLPDEVSRLHDKKSCLRLFQHYMTEDFYSAGLQDDGGALGGVSEGDDHVRLWRNLAPFWDSVKNAGYARAIRISVKELYGIDTINESTIQLLQERHRKMIVPGFYEKVLREYCRVESSQVDRWSPVAETAHPGLLLADININFFLGFGFSPEHGGRVGVGEIRDLSAYHDFIRRWFRKFGPRAAAIKSPIAYQRGLDFEKVPAEAVDGLFKRVLEKSPLSPEEKKRLEDHLFWFCVGLADEHNLPVKLHTGYYAGRSNWSWLTPARIEKNVAQAADLCLGSPETRFMFMHTAYPYGHELVSVAKYCPNAHVQTCWAWIIDPFSTKGFLKQYLATAPSNKIHTFGGDYVAVENVVGHARMARNGVYAALAELVDEGYLDREDALDLVEPLLRGNARRIFNLEKKYEIAKSV